MSRVSTVLVTLLGIVTVSLSSSYAEEPIWPLRQRIDLSSGFGDFREGRFHAGVDIRTAGRIGRRLLSPVDGYVWRVKMSYIGYGKGLYIMGDDGYIYVFGHLNGFNREIDRAVKQAQTSVSRYYLDTYFPRDSIRVGKGEILGMTGQTGTTSGPHLHFEKRTPDNMPINPLTHGYVLEDTARPVFSRVGFEMTDGKSLFANGRRKRFVDTKRGEAPGRYRIDSVLYFHRPFGLLIDGYDQMHPGGMKQAIYRLTAYLDGRPIYETVFDTVDFETGKAVGLEYDYLQVLNGETHVRRIYQKTANLFAGSRALNGHSGMIGLEKDLALGLHTMLVVGEDCFGNTAELTFDFVWGPPSDVFHLDSIVEVEKRHHDFYFSPTEGYESLGLDSVYVMFNPREKWIPTTSARVVRLDEGRIRAEIRAKYTLAAVLCLVAKSRYGCEIWDEPFNGLRYGVGKRTTLNWEIVEDGLIVKLETRASMANEARLDFYYRDSLLGREYPARYFNKNEYFFFIPPRPQYRLVDRIDLSWYNDTTARVALSENVYLAAVGFQEERAITVDSLFTIMIGRENLFEPCYIGLKKDQVVVRSLLGMNSDFYEVFPEAFVTRKDFDVKLRITSRHLKNDRSGLCWLDVKKDRWIWLEDSRYQNDIISATSRGGGAFGAVFDFDPPRIDRLNLVPRETVETAYPAIEFRLSDTLSGIADDRSIDIRIDRKWMIPEYDPQTEICKTQPIEPLDPGEHHLAIIVIDRAGNKAEKYLIFNVRDHGQQSGDSR